LSPDAARLNAVVHQHWEIENILHWVLDVGFGEDLDRKRVGHAAQNFSLLNRIALNLLKHETTFKQARYQGQKAQSRLKSSLLAEIAGNLICVGPVRYRALPQRVQGELIA
jgi:hypothetical protein